MGARICWGNLDMLGVLEMLVMLRYLLKFVFAFGPHRKSIPLGTHLNGERRARVVDDEVHPVNLVRGAKV